jgi:hypothetical protein
VGGPRYKCFVDGLKARNVYAADKQFSCFPKLEIKEGQAGKGGWYHGPGSVSLLEARRATGLPG